MQKNGIITIDEQSQYKQPILEQCLISRDIIGIKLDGKETGFTGLQGVVSRKTTGLVDSEISRTALNLYIMDMVAKSIMSKCESERLFCGNPAFYKTQFGKNKKSLKKELIEKRNKELQRELNERYKAELKSGEKTQKDIDAEIENIIKKEESDINKRVEKYFENRTEDAEELAEFVKNNFLKEKKDFLEKNGISKTELQNYNYFLDFSNNENYSNTIYQIVLY